jgi:hypothetical protein
MRQRPPKYQKFVVYHFRSSSLGFGIAKEGEELLGAGAYHYRPKEF